MSTEILPFRIDIPQADLDDLRERLTWVLAVSGDRNRRPAISSLDRPSATSASTSRSRSVSPASTRSLDGRRSGRVARSVMSRRVTLGDSSASPLATTRTAWRRSAGSVSLTRKPLAPARIAW